MHHCVNKVNFINGDFRDYNSSLLSSYKPLVWISNLCFDQETTNMIFTKILEEFPIGTIIACSKPHDFSNSRIELVQIIKINMSWSHQCTVHIYTITDNK